MQRLIVCVNYCRKASDQGHPHASYNVALGHIKGIRTDLLKSGCVELRLCVKIASLFRCLLFLSACNLWQISGAGGRAL